MIQTEYRRFKGGLVRLSKQQKAGKRRLAESGAQNMQNTPKAQRPQKILLYLDMDNTMLEATAAPAQPEW